MNYLYVVKSLKNKKRYVGSTKMEPEQKVKQYNDGTDRLSRQNKPFELIYTERYPTFTEAKKREIYLKTNNGQKELDTYCF